VVEAIDYLLNFGGWSFSHIYINNGMIEILITIYCA